MTVGRDYCLTGVDGRLALERGLASAQWYASPIPRRRMKELMRRSDRPALRDTAIWLGAMALFGGLGVWFWGSWLALPFFLCYGVLYGSASDSRWHECGHGTAFRTRWMNDVVYHLASFMIMREPTVWRWSHTRHHTDTLIVGRDPEIVAMRPPRLARILANFFGLAAARDGGARRGGARGRLASVNRARAGQQGASYGGPGYGAASGRPATMVPAWSSERDDRHGGAGNGPASRWRATVNRV